MAMSEEFILDLNETCTLSDEECNERERPTPVDDPVPSVRKFRRQRKTETKKKETNPTKRIGSKTIGVREHDTEGDF